MPAMFVPNDWAENANISAVNGQFGDYIGGVWGTILALITLLVVALT